MSTILTLPNETLSHILSYSLPRKECQVWEWIGIMSQTCRSFRQIAQTQHVPTCMYLSDFEQYQRLAGGIIVDARVGILQSLLRYSWKRTYLKELHCNWSSVLPQGARRLRNNDVHEGTIRILLRTFLTTPASLPALEWIDINLQSDLNSVFNLIDAETLRGMPSALPSLKKLCLCNCFNHNREDNREEPGMEWMDDYSPEALRQFFVSLQTPLESISLMELCCMSDAHVEAFLPIVGEHLTRLELTCCHYFDSEDYDESLLTDRSALCIAKHCTNLESCAMVESDITAAGLQHVLSNNPHIVTLDLSNSFQLDTSVVAVISRYLPKIRKIRNYWSRFTNWLTDDSLMALVDALSRNSGGMCLDLIGLQSEDTLTARGMEYAIKKGVKEIEIDERSEGDLWSFLSPLSDVTITEPPYIYYIEGSSCGASATEWLIRC